MSKTVDERIVEMRFDNRNFESNVATSMSTLDKLKQKLNLTGASKNLESLNAAAKRVDFSPVSNSLDNVVTRFSHAQMTLQHQIDRYMDKLVMMGERAVKALTIDPIKTGFQEYETQMNSVQTILANTQSKGSTLDDVNKALDELNTYADKTIYNFTEMTRNIGTFTAAGIELDTSVNAIQGIANLAAISGSTSQQASTAMYQLSQALSSGTVRLMDWNSVVNAGMGGEVFQNALKETSKLLGTGAEAAIKAKGSFRESLQTGWLTAEVLTETLKKFTTTGANEYVAEYIGESPEFVQAALDKADALAKEAAARGEEIDAIEEASKTLAEHSGKSKDEIKSILGMARNAEDAATKVKTFTQLWDVLKESAQSGWSQTWKLIIGDFQEAKDLLSPLADVLTGFIGKMSDARNWIVQGVLDFTTPWTNIMKKLEGSGLLKTVQKVTDSVTDAAKKLEYYQDVVNRVWRGDYKNADTGRYGLLDADDYNHKVVQSLVNKGYQYELTIEDIEEAEKKFGVTIGETAETTQEMSNVIANLSDEQLRNAGLTEEEIRLYRDLEKYAKKSGISVDELAKKMSENDGRTLLIDSFKNIGNSIMSIFTAIGQAWKDVFDPISIVGIYHVIEAFNNWTKSLKLVDEHTGELNETGQKIKRTLAGVFAIVDVLTTILGGGFKIAFKVVSAILEYFNLDLLSFTAMIGDALVAFSDWFDSIFDVSGAVRWLIDTVKKAIPVVKGWIEAFSELPFVQKVINGIKTAFTNLKSINLRDIGKWIVEGFQGGFADGIKNMLTAVFDFGKKILSTICDVLGIQSPSKEFFDIATWCIKGFVNGIIAGVKFVATGMVNLGKSILDAFQNSGVIEGVKTIFGKIKDLLSKLDLGKILSIIPIGIALILVKKIYDFASSFGKVVNHIDDILENAADVVAGFAKVLKGLSFKMYAEGIKQLAISLAIMVGSLIVLTLVDADKLYDAVAIVMLLALTLGALAFAMGMMSKASASFKKGEGLQISGLTSSLASIGLAILMLAASIKLIGSMDPDAFGQGMKGLAAIIAGLVIVMVAFKGLGDNKSAENIDKVGKMIFKLSLSMLLLVAFCKLVGKLEWTDMGKAAAFAGGFIIFVSLLCETANGCLSDVDKVGKMIFKLSLSMILLVAFCKLAGKLEREEMIKGALFAAGFAVFVGLLVKATKIDKEQQMAKLGGMLLSITLAMMLMVGVCKLVRKLEVEDIIAGAAFMIGFILFAKLLTKVTTISNEQKSAKIAGAILAIAVAVAALAVVSVLMSMMSTEGLIKGVGAVVALSLGMAAMIAATKNVKADAMKPLLSLVAAIVVMAIAVGVLSTIDKRKLAASTICISALIAVFSMLVKATSTIKNTKGLFTTILSMTAVVAVFGLLLERLAQVAKVNGSNSLIASAVSLSILMIAMLGCMKIMSMIETSVGKAFKGALGLATLAIPMLAFIAMLAWLSKIDKVSENVAALTKLMIAMTAVTAVLAIIGNFVGQALLGALSLLLLAVPMAAFMGILIWMNHIENAQANVELILKLMGSLTDMLVKLALVAPLALVGVVAILLLEAAIVAFGILALAVGALMEKNPTLEEFLNKGIPILIQLAGGLGEAISAFMGGLSAQLPTIGQNLTDFMTKVQGFIDGVRDVDGDVVTGATNLATAILAISGAELVAGFVELVTYGTDLVGLGTSLSKFMDEAGTFITGLKNIDEKAVSAARSLAEMIKALTVAELIDGIASWFDIDIDFGDFGEELSAFGESMVAFSNAITSGNGIDSGAVEAAASAGQIMAALQQDIGATGGVLQWILGEKNLENFGGQLTSFGAGIMAFSNSVSGGVKTEAVEAAASAGQIMAALQQDISSEGGLMQLLLGNKDLGKFGEQLKAFGEAMVGFSNTVDDGAISQEAVEAAARAGMLMANLESSLQNSGGFIARLTGDNDLGTFGENLEDFGDDLLDFSDTVKGIDSGAIEAAAKAGEMMATLDASIPSDKWLDGKVSLEDFGEQISEFGCGLEDFADECKLIDPEEVANAEKSVSSLSRMLTDIGYMQNNVDNLSFFDTYETALETFAESLESLANDTFSSVTTTTITNVTSACVSLSDMITSLEGLKIGGTTKLKEAVNNLLSIDIPKLISHYSGDVSGVSEIGTKLMTAIKTGFEVDKNPIKSALSTMISGASNIADDYTTTYSNKGTALVNSLVNGITSMKEAPCASMADIASAAAAATEDKYTSFYSAGSYLVDGFKNGISANSYKAAAQASAMATAAKNAAEEALGINSPSQVFYGIGDYTGQGFVNALADYAAKSYKAGSEMADSARKGLTNAIGKATDMLSGKTDMQPTIRPVVDLSGVESGTSAINSMLSMGSRIGISANVGVVSSMMSRRNQNGANSDIVAAIDRLDKHLDNVGGTSYNVNGVTYDDGSNVKDAIETIVRAARIERRV